ncbi:MAG: HNH endonuclease [Bacteroidales bacterium]|nr:HNH endonuclease [Bacteroidales bacterium]
MATELTKEQFKEVLRNEVFTKPENIFDFQSIYSFDNHQAPANLVVWKNSKRKNLLLHKEGPRPVGPINLRVGLFGKKVAKKYLLTLDKWENGKPKYYSVFFNGWCEGNLFIWQLKPNLVKALEELGLVEKKSDRDFTLDQINKEFEEKVKSSKNDSQQERQKRLKLAGKKPTSTSAQINVFLRNPDVKAEVLHRACGHCEYCQSPAPFKKDSDGEDFLEVHHIISLAQGGDDTVENAVALCPNCHRHAHYGKNSFDIEKLK